MNDLILIIGGTNQGKSYFAKQSIQDEKIPCFVYDVQNCYGSTSTKEGDLILNLPIGTKEKRCRWFGNKNEFIELAILRKHSVILIEEATIFFEGKTQERTRELIVNKHHDKNTIIFMFHSINAVPPRIAEMADKVVLFKTGDEPKNIERKFARFVPYFLKLKNAPDRTKIIFKNTKSIIF